jgi:hypothetical protein
MRILSVHHGFSADHSSSTYEFFALQPLTSEQRAAVQALTGEAGRRHLSFTYHGDWSDLPSAWPDKLLTSGYDILVSESYDWWGVHLALPHDADLLERLAAYECESDSNGFSIRALGERMVLYFGMNLDYGAAYDIFGEEIFEGLADLFERVREELLAGNLSAAWAMYSTYGGEAEDGPEPVEPLSSSGQTLLGIMECH